MDLNLRLHTAWISRNHNEIADEFSKTIDGSDWGVSNEFFTKMEKLCRWKFDLDAFANHRNFKVSKFYCRWMVPGSAGLDGLAQDWNGQVVWMVPPLFLLPAALNHLERCRSKGMLVFPSMQSHIINLLVILSGRRGHVRGKWEFPGRGVFVDGRSSMAYGSRYNGPVAVVKLDFSNRGS